MLIATASHSSAQGCTSGAVQQRYLFSNKQATSCRLHLHAQVTPTSMVLHYYSQRVGLWMWVEGIVDEVAKQIFGIQVRMERLRGRDTGDCDHEVSVGVDGRAA